MFDSVTDRVWNQLNKGVGSNLRWMRPSKHVANVQHSGNGKTFGKSMLRRSRRRTE